MVGHGPEEAEAPGDDRPRALIAADLHRRFGDALDITVGSKPFPPDRITDFRTVPLPVSDADLPLAVDIRFEPAAVVAGEDLRGTATLTNEGRDRLRFITGGVRHPGDDKLAGVFRGPQSAAALAADLDHGQSRDVPVLMGTASCLPDRSYAVPAGTYEVVADLSLNQRDDEGRPTGLRHLVVIGPPIEVTTDGPTTS